MWPTMVTWAAGLPIAPFKTLAECGHCGVQRARPDGFCGKCGLGNGSGYVSFQVIEAKMLSDPSRWAKKTKVETPSPEVQEAPRAEQMTLIEGVGPEQKKRRKTHGNQKQSR